MVHTQYIFDGTVITQLLICRLLVAIWRPQSNRLFIRLHCWRQQYNSIQYENKGWHREAILLPEPRPILKNRSRITPKPDEKKNWKAPEKKKMKGTRIFYFKLEPARPNSISLARAPEMSGISGFSVGRGFGSGARLRPLMKTQSNSYENVFDIIKVEKESDPFLFQS